MIGQGGMGAVYRARQPSLDRFVALKILATESSHDPEFAERFAREARVLARLNHPHIVNVYDSGRAGPYYYFLMEFVEGVNLRSLLRSGDLSPTQALAIVPQICDALQYAHEEGVVHRDIKPENILLDQRGRVKVADFGLAKLVSPGQLDHSLTGTHQVMGTPRYMAPEQLEGTHHVDHRADIYSLGVVFYELLTGELPLGRFAPPSQRARVDARLDEVVLRTLEKEPIRRYQHASDVKTELESLGVGVAPAWARVAGYDYRTRAKILGIPWIHVTSGFDPATGRPRCAVGVIAVGPRAVGGLAVGGGALGIAAVGGVSGGLFSLGGCSVGLLVALGGAAIGLGISAGGLAVGTVALGGCAAGILAVGGAAFGVYRLGGNVPGGRNFALPQENQLASDASGPLGTMWPPWDQWLSRLPAGPEPPTIPAGEVGGVGGQPTLFLLVLLAVLGMAAVGMFLAVVAGTIVAVRAGTRRRGGEGSRRDSVAFPSEYQPPPLTKQLPPGGRVDFEEEAARDRSLGGRLLLVLAAVAGFLLCVSWAMGRAMVVPLWMGAVVVAVLVWWLSSSRSCLLALGILGLMLVGAALLLGSYFTISHSVEVEQFDTQVEMYAPPDAEPAPDAPRLELAPVPPPAEP
jgi:predicted Ser/Thr protein kinase